MSHCCKSCCGKSPEKSSLQKRDIPQSGVSKSDENRVLRLLAFNEEKLTFLILGISLVALVVSFFEMGNLPVDAAWLAVLLCGFPIAKEAMIGLFTEFNIKTGVLVTIALVASVVIGEIFAAGEVAFIMAIGEFLEERTVAKARAGIEKLARLTPTMARRVAGGEETMIAANEVKIGDTLRVLAGETIAVDGVIINGQSSVDQSVVTGEPLPADKTAGDSVLSGTVNQFGTFEMTAQKVGEDSSLQRMIRLVESADASRSKMVSLADQWATWVVLAALVTAMITGLVTGEVIRAVTILVVFCPCALVLSTPTAIMAGIGNATRYGILVAKGDALERLSKVNRIAFDKTGTLTFGRPTVTKIVSLSPTLNEATLFELAAAAELRSEHPLGKAVVARYRQEKKKSPEAPESFRLVAGRGVIARVTGKTFVAGNAAMLQDHGVNLSEALLSDTAKIKETGATVIFIANEKEILGYLVLSDTARPDVAETIKAIGQTGVASVLLTGDTPQAANAIAGKVGISYAQGGCLPEDKVAWINRFQNEGGAVCMVGDGINDAPALKTARVGIAMGGVGSDIAIEAADIVLVRDNIKEIPHLLALAKRVTRTINVNLSASLIINFAAIGLAVVGILNPVLGALVHNAGSVAVVLNSTLLLKWRKKATRQAASIEGL